MADTNTPPQKLTVAEIIKKAAESNLKRQETMYGKERAPNGTFLAGTGYSGNPKGRPKKNRDIVAPEVAAGNVDLPEGFHDKVGSDALEALKQLLMTAKTRREAHMLAKDLLSYQQPRLTSSESKVEKTTSFNVVWSDAPTMIEGHAEDA